MKATLLHRCSDQTGEAATWLPRLGLFLWVDIDNGLLRTYHPESQSVIEHTFPEQISAIIPRKESEEEILLAMKNRIVSYHLTHRTCTTLVEIEDLQPAWRTNDCKASPEGRLWLGVMHTQHHNETGTLYCMNNDLSLKPVLRKQSIPNGIVWNKAGDKMYYADSGRGCIEEYSYNQLTGDICFLRIAVQVPPVYGMPDGMTIDSDGLLWVAHWGGYGVYVWNPVTGRLVSKVEVPVPHVASCTFGGSDNQSLFITTALAGLDDAAKEAYPLSGSLFVAQVSNVVPSENHYPFITNYKYDET